MSSPIEKVIAYGDSQLNPFDFKAQEHFNPKTVAHSLSNICRYTGHYDFISVAEHCILVRKIMINRYHSYPNGPYNRGIDNINSAVWGMLGLLHDATESITNDISSPVKGHEWFTPFRQMEQRYLQDIFEFHNIKPTNFEWEELHRADKYAMSIELFAMGQKDNPVWAPHFERYPFDERRNCGYFTGQPEIELWTPEQAERKWLSLYNVAAQWLKINDYSPEKYGQNS
jgi:hypothetical protein